MLKGFVLIDRSTVLNILKARSSSLQIESLCVNFVCDRLNEIIDIK